MKYIVHMVDEISNHRKENEKYTIIEAEDENGDKCHVLRTDAFYYVNDVSAIDAVIAVLNLVKIKDSTGEQICLSKALQTINGDTKDEKDPVKNELINSHSSFLYSNKTDSELFFATCQFDREEKEEQWTEFHRFSIYVMEEGKIVKIAK